MGKKEEDEIIRIAKKMDKMAQKKSGVRTQRVIVLLASVARLGSARQKTECCCVCVQFSGLRVAAPQCVSYVSRFLH